MCTLGFFRILTYLVFFTDHIRRMREGNVFSLSTLVGGPAGGGGYLSQVQLGGGYPSQVQPGGLPQPGQDRRGTPWDRTVHGVLDTLQSVCLLRLCSRTFLFSNVNSVVSSCRIMVGPHHAWQSLHCVKVKEYWTKRITLYCMSNY